MKPFACSLILLAVSSLSGCSQVSYSRNDTDGYVTDYPALGADIAPLIQDMLNREGTPTLNGYATNGPVQFRVLSARVLKADDMVPSPDGTMTSIPFHAHSRMTLPNGQVLDFEHIDSLGGSWKGGRISIISLDAFIGDSHPFTWGNPQDLNILDPGVVEKTQAAIANARNRSEMQIAINDVCSAEFLFAHLQKHDLVHQQYDFSYWQQAHQIAMQHADEVFCGTGELPPGVIQPPPAPPVVQAPAPQPTPPGKAVIERYPLYVTGAIRFTIPITDPAWLHYRSALFTPRFDEQSWTAMAASTTRLQLEQHLHDVMATALKASQRQALAEHGPFESRVAQAAYVAQQPGATQSQKNAYEQLSHKEETELGPSTRHLLAFKILIDAIQDDVDAQQK